MQAQRRMLLGGCAELCTITRPYGMANRVSFIGDTIYTITTTSCPDYGATVPGRPIPGNRTSSGGGAACALYPIMLDPR